MKKHGFKLGFAVLGFAIAFQQLGHSSSPNPYNKAWNLPQTASIHITQRGQEFFKNNLSGILARNGVNFSSGKLAKFDYKMTEPLRLDKLPGEYAKYSSLLREMKKVFLAYLENFSLNDPQFSVQIRDAAYRTGPMDVSLDISPELTNELGGHGIGIILEATIPDIRIESAKIAGKDLRNSFLGTFGIHKPWIEMSNKSEPLKIKVYNRILARGQGAIDFETLKAETNLPDLKLKSGFNYLILPQVSVTINETTTKLDTTNVDRALMAKKSQLVQMLQVKLADFIVTEIPRRMNDMAWEKLKCGFSMVKELEAPGVAADSSGTPFEWGMRLRNLSLDWSFLNIQMEGYVRDPQVTWEEKNPLARPKKEPALNALPLSSYDAALAINGDIINRFIKLAWNRGTLSTIDAGGGEQMKLVQQPVFILSSKSRTHGRMLITVERETKGVKETLGLKSPYRVGLTLNVRIRKNSTGDGLDLVLDNISEDDSYVHTEYIRNIMLTGSVIDALHEKIREMNADFRRTEKLIAGDIKLPMEFYGVKLWLNHVEFDPNGYIAAYLSLVRQTLP